MQIYLPGVTGMYWKQLTTLPTGLYDKSVNQTSSSSIPQLFVDYVDKPVGTLVDMKVNNIYVDTLKVVDETGLVYTNYQFAGDEGTSTFTIDLFEQSSGLKISSEEFFTSNIGYTHELNSAFYLERIDSNEQLADNMLIESSDNELLIGKFGIMTELTPRSDQTTGQYRAQTSCLWKSFNHAGTEKGVIDSIKCLIGDVDITKEYTRDAIGNRIFDLPRFEYDDWYLPVPSIITNDTDYPHYYVGYMTLAERAGMLSYAVGQSPTERLDPTPGLNPLWDTDNVKSLTIHSVNAIGNEVILTVPTASAVISVVDQSVSRRNSAVSVYDKIGNEYIASTVVVTECYIGGFLVVGLGVPVQGVDFNLDQVTGTIEWLGTIKEPDAGSIYKVNYSFRLDEQLGVVIKQVKPSHRRVVVVFDTPVTGLPLAVIA